MATPASSRISSLAKIVAPVRRASAIESDGRALTSLPLEKIRSAKKIPSRSAVMFTVVSRMSRAASTSRIRSWVSGRCGTMPCCAKAIAVASIGPIQIGRYRSPCISFSRTMGLFVGISTRTPTTSICLTAAPSSHAPHALPSVAIPAYCHSPWLGRHSLCQRTPGIAGRPLDAPGLAAAGPAHALAPPTPRPAAGGVLAGRAGPAGPGRGRGHGPGPASASAPSISARCSRSASAGELAGGLPRQLAGPGAALPQDRRDHALDQCVSRSTAARTGRRCRASTP